MRAASRAPTPWTRLERFPPRSALSLRTGKSDIASTLPGARADSRNEGRVLGPERQRQAKFCHSLATGVGRVPWPRRLTELHVVRTGRPACASASAAARGLAVRDLLAPSTIGLTNLGPSLRPASSAVNANSVGRKSEL